MIDSSVARRYARALLELANAEQKGTKGKGAAERVGDEVSAVARAVESAPEARAALTAPGLTQAQRQQVIEALVKQLSLSATVANFLRLLLARQRLEALPAIARALTEMIDAQIGRLRAQVTSAQPLTDAELGRVRDALAKATQKTILLEARTDPGIVGGLVAQVGGKVYDGSLRTQLFRLREELKAAPI